MNSFLSIRLEKNSKSPIYKQLGEALLSLISDGVLEADSKLPPVRKMAESLRINSSTVVSAYKYLESKHAVYSFMGSGTYVAPMKSADITAISSGTPFSSALAETEILYDFTSDMLPDRFFPINEFKAEFNRLIEGSYGKIFARYDTESSEALYATVSRKLIPFDISEKRYEILFTDNFGDALEMIAKTVVNRGDYVVTEKPVGFTRVNAYAERGAKLLYVPVNSRGIDIQALEAVIKTYRPKVAHLSTYFQNPTGVCYSKETKKNVLEMCYKYGIIMVEEDIYSDLALPEKRIFLKSMDYRDMVVYVKSLTKTFLPWLNINICLIPKKLNQHREKLNTLTRIVKNGFQIRLFNAFVNTTAYESLEKKIVEFDQTHYGKNAEIINENLGEFIEFDVCSRGVFFWLKTNHRTSEILAQRCAKRGALITPGSIFSGGYDDRFRLCTRNIEGEMLLNGIKVIKEELTSMRIR